MVILPFQLVLRKRIAQRSRQTVAGRGESARHIFGPSVRTQSKWFFIIGKRLGRWTRLPREALQNQAIGQWRLLYCHQSNVPIIASPRISL